MSFTDVQLTQMAATFMAYSGWRLELDRDLTPEDDLTAWKEVYAEAGAYVIRLLVKLEGAVPDEAARRISTLLLEPDFESRFTVELASLKDRVESKPVDSALN